MIKQQPDIISYPIQQKRLETIKLQADFVILDFYNTPRGSAKTQFIANILPSYR
jgi:hypothetical protein